MSVCEHGRHPDECADCIAAGMRKAIGRDVPTDHIDWLHVEECWGEVDGTPLNVAGLRTALAKHVAGDFDLNQVPPELVLLVDEIGERADRMMLSVRELGSRMRLSLEERGRHSNGAVIDPEAVKAQQEALKRHNEFQERTGHRPQPSEARRRES